MPLTKTGKFNDIPPKLLPAIPQEPTTVVYQFLDHLSFIDSVTGKKRWNAAVVVPSISQVINPSDKLPVQIALAGGVDINGNLLPNEIRRLEFAPDASDGKVFLHIGEGRVNDEELYQYFELCSFNESNPNRNKSVAPMFRRLDFQAEAKAKIEKANQEMDALKVALTDGDYKGLAHLHGISVNQDEQLIRSALMDVAKKNPETFLALSNDPDKEAKTVLAAALAAGAVSIDADKSAIVNNANGSIILQLAATDRDSAMNEFAAFTRNDAKGTALKAVKMLADIKAKKA